MMRFSGIMTYSTLYCKKLFKKASMHALPVFTICDVSCHCFSFSSSSASTSCIFRGKVAKSSGRKRNESAFRMRRK